MATPIERANSATSIFDFLNSAALDNATETAFSCGPMTLSYADFARQGDAFAAYLQSAGVGKGDRVGLMSPNLLAFPIATLGIQKIGAVQVNINPLYTPSELEHQLNDSGVETLVLFSGTSAAFAAVRNNTGVKSVIVIHVGDGSGMEIPSPPPDEALGSHSLFADALTEVASLSFEAVTIERGALALLQYTGGTTGPSKGQCGSVLRAGSKYFHGWGGSHRDSDSHVSYLRPDREFHNVCRMWRKKRSDHKSTGHGRVRDLN